MLRIEEWNPADPDSGSAAELHHSQHVFEDARDLVRTTGVQRFHVTDDAGDYALRYVRNDDLIAPGAKKYLKIVDDIYPDYLEYDYADVEKIDVGFLRYYAKVRITALDEYAVAVANVILENTDHPIECTDARMNHFLHPGNVVPIVSTDAPLDDGCLVVDGSTESGAGSLCYDALGSLAVFNSMFYMQWLTDLRLEQVRYVSIRLMKHGGIGAVLAYLMRYSHVFERDGWKVFIEPGCTRFSDKMLNSCFKMPSVPADSDASNTVFITNTIPIMMTQRSLRASADFDAGILTPKFRGELDEYSDFVVGDKRTLGLLMRGTDYITSKSTGIRKMATVDEMLPMINDWMADGNYEQIFLATEDDDIKERMQETFPGRIRMVAQRRARVSDFKDVTLISELEKEQRSGQDYEDALYDTTVNYVYALYILSRCTSFMCSGQCSGWDMVLAFNDDSFERCHKFSVGLEG